MRPAFSSRTKRRGATTLAPALRLFFLTASDMWHPYGDLTRNWSALDRNCAANNCHDIEWDDRRWNGCASSSLSSGAGSCLLRTHIFRTRKLFWAPVYGRFSEGFCDSSFKRRRKQASAISRRDVPEFLQKPSA